METQPEFGFKEPFTHLVGDMAKAVSQRPGETTQQQNARSQAATYVVMGLQPRDVIEAMLAGHCMMFHELLVDSMRNTICGEADPVRRATRASIVSINQAFDNCLSRLEYYQTRPSEGHRDAAGSASAPEVKSAAGAARKQDTPARARPEMSSPGIGTKPGARDLEATVVFKPSQEAIDACIASPEAMAALDAGDPVRFARAMGIEEPCEAYITAATEQMSAWSGKGVKNGKAKDDGVTVGAGGNGAGHSGTG